MLEETWWSSQSSYGPKSLLDCCIEVDCADTFVIEARIDIVRADQCGPEQ